MKIVVKSFVLLLLINDAFSQEVTNNYKSKDINIRDNLDERLDKYNELRDGKLLKGIPTGFDKIDSETGGIFNTDFVVLFGKAKSFKTFLLIGVVAE